MRPEGRPLTRLRRRQPRKRKPVRTMTGRKACQCYARRHQGECPHGDRRVLEIVQ